MMGLCQCGCGETTPVYTRHRVERGVRKGDPMRFIRGHQNAPVPWPKRFRRRFKPLDEGCWLWRGGVNPDGYGTFTIEGKHIGAHRAAYEYHCGPIPDGTHVCHTCDNPSCVNPDHLFVGTVADNMADMRRKRRSRPGENHPQAKLKWVNVQEIREESQNGVPQSHLASFYGVSQPTISAIVQRKIWRVGP